MSFINLIELRGNNIEIKNFLDNYTFFSKFNYCQKPWYKSIIAKFNDSSKCKDSKISINCLVFKNSCPIDDCIKDIIHFFKNIEIKYCFYDIRLNIQFGWLYCLDGKIIEENILPLNLGNNFRNLTIFDIKLFNNQKDILENFIRDNKELNLVVKNYNDYVMISFSIENLTFDKYDKLFFQIDKYKSSIKSYNFMNLFKKYYGYKLYINNICKYKNFINFSNSNNLFLYSDLKNFIINNKK